MPGFCGSIVFAFILGEKLFNYVVDGIESARAWLEEKAKCAIWHHATDNLFIVRLRPNMSIRRAVIIKY